MAERRMGRPGLASQADSRLPEHLFQEKNGQWYGEFGEFRIRSVFRPIYRRLTSRELALDGFECAVKVLAFGRKCPLAEVIGEFQPDDRNKIERICRAVQFRNFAISGGGRCNIYYFNSYMNRSGLEDPDYGIRSIPKRMARFGLKPEQSIAEFSGGSGIEPDVIVASAKLLRETGTQIALRNFGLPHTGAGWLASVDPQIVGIDAELLKQSVQNSEAADLLRSLIELAVGRGIWVLMDGIDTPAEFEIALSTKATLFRGDLLGRLVSRLVSANTRIETSHIIDAVA